MKFGLHFQLPCAANQSPVRRYRDTIEQAVHAERLGFESVWPVEQHFNPDLSILPAPLLLLAAVAERTRTLRLGVAIVLLPLSHPVRIAEEIATLDVISGGRVEFGVGRGAIPAHFAGFGVPQAESRDRLLEGLDAILRAWNGDRLSHDGRYFRFEDLSVVPKPIQQPYPPIRVAANSMDSFELLGRMGYDICVATQVNPFPKLKELVPMYRQARVAAGHPSRGGEDLTLLCPLFVGESQRRIREIMEPGVNHFIQVAASLFAGVAAKPEGGAIRLQKAAERARRLTYEKFTGLMGVFETPAMCVRRLKLIQEEFNPGRLICWFNPGGMAPHQEVMRAMEMFAAEVMPHFQ